MQGQTGPRRRQTGLTLLALFLVLSGVLRLGNGVGLAAAQTAAPAGEAGQAVPATAGPACVPDAGAMAMLESLRERERRIAGQEQKQAVRQQTLDLAQAEVDRKLAELDAAERKLSATIAVADQAADRDVARLVSVYETMKPKDAARLFAEMDGDFAAGFLARMRPDAAAAVLAGLDPAKGYAISVRLAGRNALGPKN
ncbi:MAG: hypothetical protein JSS08_01295 [Proteobacteria bacterium]|nr:hypothetical protein [Pseudomonadota bacterium]